MQPDTNPTNPTIPEVPFIVTQSSQRAREVTEQLTGEGNHVFSYIRFTPRQWREKRSSQPGVVVYHPSADSVVRAAIRAAELGYPGYHVLDGGDRMNLEAAGLLPSRIAYVGEGPGRVCLPLYPIAHKEISQ